MKFSATFAAFLMLTPSAFAGETSRSSVLGFSQNGRYFAFEEFGISDGSGSPYATLYVIDSKDDSWVKGTPVSLATTEDEGQAIEEKTAKLGLTNRFQIEQQYELALVGKRQKTVELAGNVLSQIQPLYAGETRVLNTPYEYTTNAKSVRFSTIGYQQVLFDGTDKKVWRLDVDQKQFPGRDDCYGMYDATYGYKLTLTNENTGETRILNDDTRVPKSRGCVQGYQIEQVVSFEPDGTENTLAILIRYSKPGFEGPDGRLLAVTTRIPK